MNIEKIKQVGIGAAYRAGKILKEHFGKLEMVKNKGAIDLVTEADIAAEKAIIDAIHASFPDHSIVAEEGGSYQGSPENCWYIDPLDGTTNYAHNLGFFCVSIAFYYKKEASVGIVLNPVNAELFIAAKGQGAQLNSRPINVSDKKTLQESLLVTGFPYNLNTILNRLITRFKNCLSTSQGVRRLGSAALDLCYVACGRFDGFWEENLNPWDTAAGVLIAQEAGAKVTDFKNRPFHIGNKKILATNGLIHSEMMTLLNSEDNI